MGRFTFWKDNEYMQKDVHVRFTDAEYCEIARLAAQDGWSISGYVRQLVRGALFPEK